MAARERRSTSPARPAPFPLMRTVIHVFLPCLEHTAGLQKCPRGARPARAPSSHAHVRGTRARVGQYVLRCRAWGERNPCVRRCGAWRCARRGRVTPGAAAVAAEVSFAARRGAAAAIQAKTRCFLDARRRQQSFLYAHPSCAHQRPCRDVGARRFFPGTWSWRGVGRWATNSLTPSAWAAHVSECTRPRVD